MTPKPNEPVLDVNVDEYSLNGKVIGKTVSDFTENNEVWWLIKTIDHELKESSQWVEEGFSKLHVDENLSFGDFFKCIVTIGYSASPTVHYTIGDNFKDVYNVKLPTSSLPSACYSFIVRKVTLSRYKYGRNRSKLLLNEFLSVDNQQRESELDCFKDYNVLDLVLTFYGSKDDRTYVISLNEGALKENPSFDGFSFYSFNNLADLWKFIADIRSKEKLQNDSNDVKSSVAKCTSDLFGKHASLIFENDELMKDIAPLLKGLKAYGYNGAKINFMQVN